MQSTTEGLSRFKPVFEQLPNALKVTGIAGSACGFIYIFAYMRATGIPFPLELSVLPTLLLLVGITSVIATILLVGGILIPALMADNPSSVTRSYFLAVEDAAVSLNCTSKSRSKTQIVLRRYLVCSWIPMVTALIALMFLVAVEEIRWKTELALFFLGVSVVWIVATPFVVRELKEKRWQYIATTIPQTILSLWAYCLAVILFAALYPEVGKWPAWKGFLLLLVVFTPIHMLITLPHRKGNTRVLLAPFNEHEVIPATSIVFVVAVCITFISLFMGPVSAKVGETALRAFGIGGGVPVRICLKSKPPEDITQLIAFSSDYCSELTALLFDSGDKVYVTKLAREQNLDGDRPSQPRQDFIYFRQDDIRAKIYQLPIKKKEEDSTSVSSAKQGPTEPGGKLTEPIKDAKVKP